MSSSNGKNMLASGMLVFRAGLCAVGYEFWLQLFQVPYYARLASEAGITFRGCQWQLRVPNRTGRAVFLRGFGACWRHPLELVGWEGHLGEVPLPTEGGCQVWWGRGPLWRGSGASGCYPLELVYWEAALEGLCCWLGLVVKGAIWRSLVTAEGDCWVWWGGGITLE